MSTHISMSPAYIICSNAYWHVFLFTFLDVPWYLISSECFLFWKIACSSSLHPSPLLYLHPPQSHRFFIFIYKYIFFFISCTYILQACLINSNFFLWISAHFACVFFSFCLLGHFFILILPSIILRMWLLLCVDCCASLNVSTRLTVYVCLLALHHDHRLKNDFKTIVWAFPLQVHHLEFVFFIHTSTNTHTQTCFTSSTSCSLFFGDFSICLIIFSSPPVHLDVKDFFSAPSSSVHTHTQMCPPLFLFSPKPNPKILSHPLSTMSLAKVTFLFHWRYQRLLTTTSTYRPPKLPSKTLFMNEDYLRKWNMEKWNIFTIFKKELIKE